ncbi:MAG: c-type cytochrome [Pyrinomonadaceae bacterium]
MLIFTFKCSQLDNSQKLRIAVLLILCPVSLLVVGREAHTQNRAAKTANTTAERKFKNIHVLRNMPADQLGKVMNIMTASLGVGCSYCHAGYDFEKDSNPKKVIARHMLRMTFDLNRQYFSGKPVISCNTCHNGSPEPTARPRLDGPMPMEGKAETDATQKVLVPNPRAILGEHDNAIGRPEKRALIKTLYFAAERIEPDGTVEKEEVWQSIPGKMLVKTTYSSGYVITEGFNGTTAWKASNGKSIELKADEKAQIRQNALVATSLLTDIYGTLKFGFEIELEGRRVNVVAAETLNGIRDELYFDHLYHFLLRRESSTPTVLGDFVYRVDFSDYREFDGIRIPVTSRFSMPGVRWTRRIQRVEINPVIDAGLFDPPPRSKK